MIQKPSCTQTGLFGKYMPGGTPNTLDGGMVTVKNDVLVWRNFFIAVVVNVLPSIFTCIFVAVLITLVTCFTAQVKVRGVGHGLGSNLPLPLIATKKLLTTGKKTGFPEGTVIVRVLEPPKFPARTR